MKTGKRFKMFALAALVVVSPMKPSLAGSPDAIKNCRAKLTAAINEKDIPISTGDEMEAVDSYFDELCTADAANAPKLAEETFSILESINQTEQNLARARSTEQKLAMKRQGKKAYNVESETPGEMHRFILELGKPCAAIVKNMTERLRKEGMMTDGDATMTNSAFGNMCSKDPVVTKEGALALASGISLAELMGTMAGEGQKRQLYAIMAGNVITVADTYRKIGENPFKLPQP